MKISQQPPAFSTRLGIIMLFAWLMLPMTVLGGVSEGVTWLATQQNTNGSFGGTSASLATPIHSTTEALRAYQALGQTSQPVFAPALNFLNADTEVNTEYLARKIIVNVQAGNDVTALINELLIHQNLDGGFGDQPGYDSSSFDTAFALEALATANYNSGQFVAATVGYLLNHQNANGGWAEGDNDSSATLTALTHRALGFYRVIYIGVSTALANSQNYLLAQRNASGLWAEDFRGLCLERQRCD